MTTVYVSGDFFKAMSTLSRKRSKDRIEVELRRNEKRRAGAPSEVNL